MMIAVVVVCFKIVFIDQNFHLKFQNYKFYSNKFTPKKFLLFYILNAF